jgi:hypothetical protein
MPWYKIVLTKKQVENGEIKNLHQNFRDFFYEVQNPSDMGLFAGSPLENGEIPFYLTPACEKPAKGLISQYSGKTCEKPKKLPFEPTLAIGYSKVWNLL